MMVGTLSGDMDDLDASAGLPTARAKNFVHLVFRFIDEVHIQVIPGLLRGDRQWVDLRFHQVLKEMGPVRWLGAKPLLCGHLHQGAGIEDIGIGDGHALHRVRRSPAARAHQDKGMLLPVRCLVGRYSGPLRYNLREYPVDNRLRIDIDDVFDLAHLALAAPCACRERLCPVPADRSAGTGPIPALQSSTGSAAGIAADESPVPACRSRGERNGEFHIHRQLVLFRQAGQDCLHQRHKAPRLQQAVEGQHQCDRVDAPPDGHGGLTVSPSSTDTIQRSGDNPRPAPLSPARWSAILLQVQHIHEMLRIIADGFRGHSGRSCGWLRLIMRG